MSRDASVTLDFADGTYVFRLAWGQLIELQEKCDAGPLVVMRRLEQGTWLVQDVSNILRLGLIGGGMEPIPALKLVRRYVEDRPPLENLLRAQAVLTIAMMGAPDEDVKKKRRTARPSTPSPTANSGSRPSTDQPLS